VIGSTVSPLLAPGDRITPIQVAFLLDALSAKRCRPDDGLRKEACSARQAAPWSAFGNATLKNHSPACARGT